VSAGGNRSKSTGAKRSAPPRRANVPSLGSLLVGSSRPDELKLFYRRAFDVEENPMGAFEFGAVQLFIEPHTEVQGSAAEPARCIVNFDVEDCVALAAHLKDLGARTVRSVSDEPFGRIATFADPDGNYLQIIEWSGAAEGGGER
jgi:predicted enzyme related to lactoylglutathione lyase